MLGIKKRKTVFNPIKFVNDTTEKGLISYFNDKFTQDKKRYSINKDSKRIVPSNGY